MLKVFKAAMIMAVIFSSLVLVTAESPARDWDGLVPTNGCGKLRGKECALYKELIFHINGRLEELQQEIRADVRSDIQEEFSSYINNTLGPWLGILQDGITAQHSDIQNACTP